VVGVSFYLRWRTVPLAKEGWFDADVYRFVRQAQIISESGKLPERDEMRWVPVGRDLTKLLNFFPYFLASLYKMGRKAHPTLTLTDIALVYPPLCFALSLIVFYFLVGNLFSCYTAVPAVLFLATIPTAFIRSTPGYADRDALCLFLSLVLYLCLVQAFDASRERDQCIWAGLGGFSQGLLNVTWEGSGLFSAVVGGFFVLRVLRGQVKKRDTILCLGWAVPSLLTLAFLTKAYQNLNAYALLAWGCPMFAGSSIGIYLIVRRYLMKKGKISALNPVHLGVYSIVGFLVGALVLVSAFTDGTSGFLRGIYDNLHTPLGRNRLLRVITELQPSFAVNWAQWYGVSLLLILAGTLVSIWQVSRAWGMNPLLCIIAWQVLFGGIVYSLFAPFGPFGRTGIAEAVFAFTLLGSCAVIFVSIARTSVPQRVKFHSRFDKKAFALIWFLVMLIVTRGAVRYHFFFASVASIFLAHALVWPIQAIWQRPPMRIWRWGLAGIVCLCISLFTLTFVRQSLAITKQPLSTPLKPWREAMVWMKETLPPKSVVASWWDYGSQINLIGNQATILDEDQWIPYWIHLMARLVFCGSDEREALSFLKAHNASYLALMQRDLELLDTISRLGSNEILDRKVMPVISLRAPKGPDLLEKGNYMVPLLALVSTSGDFSLVEPDKGTQLLPGEWYLTQATLSFSRTDDRFIPKKAVIGVVTQNNERLVFFPERVRIEDIEIVQKDAHLPGTLVCIPPRKNTKVWRAFYISKKVEKMLSVRLLLLNEKMPSFRRIYPTDQSIYAPEVGIWKIEYPSEIRFRSEYIALDFPEDALRQAWRRGD
jgi:asparagine N-glycosylation enzyme membrane subunit Stt3